MVGENQYSQTQNPILLLLLLKERPTLWLQEIQGRQFVELGWYRE